LYSGLTSVSSGGKNSTGSVAREFNYVIEEGQVVTLCARSFDGNGTATSALIRFLEEW